MTRQLQRWSRIMFDHDNDDTLSRVSITEAVMERWVEAAKRAAATLALSGLDPTSIPDELAAVQADGSLLIYVDLPTGLRVSVIAEPGEWVWTGPRNQ